MLQTSIVSLIFVTTLFSLNISDLRKEFNEEAIIIENNLDQLRASINNAKDNNTGNNYTREIDVYINIWEIKLHFLNGEIDSSKILLDSLSAKTDTFKTVLCNDTVIDDNVEMHYPYEKNIQSCLEEECICDDRSVSLLNKLNPKFDNIDFLSDKNFYRYYSDIGIEINDGNSRPYPIKEKSSAKIDEEYVQVILNPPNIKIPAVDYDKKSTANDIMKYYYYLSRKNNLIKRESEFQRGQFRNLEFYESYAVSENSVNYYFIYKNVPRMPKSTISDKSSLYYKMYIKEGEEGGVKSRYSFNLKEKKKKSKNKIESMTSILIRWDEDWKMQKWWDQKNVFLLFPDRYLEDDINYALYKIGDVLISDSDTLSSQGYSKTATNIDISNFNVSESDSIEIVGEDGNIRVVKIAIPYDSRESIYLDFTDQYADELYSNKNEELKTWRRRLIWSIVSSVILLALVI